MGRRAISPETLKKVVEMKQKGLSYGQIGNSLGFTRQRAEQLYKRACNTVLAVAKK